MRATAAAVVILVLASPAAVAKKSRESKTYARLAHVPEAAKARVSPLEADAETIAGGRKLYDRHCAGCHGAAGADGRKGPTLRVHEVQSATPGALFWVITNGSVRSGMPVWSKLPEPQRWQITAYIQSLGVAPVAGHPPN